MQQKTVTKQNNDTANGSFTILSIPYTVVNIPFATVLCPYYKIKFLHIPYML